MVLEIEVVCSGAEVEIKLAGDAALRSSIEWKGF